jgi:BRCT domain type II-containing protein
LTEIPLETKFGISAKTVENSVSEIISIGSDSDDEKTIKFPKKTKLSNTKILGLFFKFF